MKYVSIFVFLLTFNCFAATPFDAFVGEFSVTHEVCRDLITGNSEVQNEIDLVSISKSSEDSIEILREGPRSHFDLSFEEGLGAKFSGDGANEANWIQILSDKDYYFELRHSVVKVDNHSKSYEIEQRHFDSRNETNNHFICTYSLTSN